MGKFTATTRYLNGEITITADEFLEVHEALAGIAELNADFRYLNQEKGIPAAQIIPMVRHVGSDTYWGVIDAISGVNVSYGEFREPKTDIPVYPKGEKGFYDYKDRPSESRDKPARGAPVDDEEGRRYGA